ncbi:hypothetical protein J6590_073716 [Homalodisca vitripennis]|nr:hypothetical protein J6590_073716 [Homalodisca vitripennis]
MSDHSRLYHLARGLGGGITSIFGQVGFPYRAEVGQRRAGRGMALISDGHRWETQEVLGP